MTLLTWEIHESIMAKAEVDPAFELSTVDKARPKALQHSDDASGPLC